MLAGVTLGPAALLALMALVWRRADGTVTP
jgi:hypothetical protein